MTVETFLHRLEGVRPRGIGKWTAKCPSHADKSPSLAICEVHDRILVHCFAQCEKKAIVSAMGLTLSDLFFDAPDFPTAYRKRVRLAYDRQRKAGYAEVDGFAIDALREADYFARSQQGLDITTWRNEQLSEELDALAEAYELLWAEELAEWT